MTIIVPSEKSNCTYFSLLFGTFPPLSCICFILCGQDIPADIFSDNPANKNVSGDDKKKVEHLKAMLGTNNDEGNIFVIHSTDDYTLKVVSPNLFNRGVQRLGLSGFNGIRDDFKDDVTNVNAKGNINSGSIGHNYQYDKWTIEQYHNLPTTTKK